MTPAVTAHSDATQTFRLAPEPLKLGRQVEWLGPADPPPGDGPVSFPGDAITAPQSASRAIIETTHLETTETGQPREEDRLESPRQIAAGLPAPEEAMVCWRSCRPPEALRLSYGIGSHTIEDLLVRSLDMILRENDALAELRSRVAAPPMELTAQEVERQSQEAAQTTAPCDPTGLEQATARVRSAIAAPAEAPAEASGSQPCTIPVAAILPAGTKKRHRFGIAMARLFLRRRSGDGGSSRDGGSASGPGEDLHSLYSLTTSSHWLRNKAASAGARSECVACMDQFRDRETVRTPCHSYCSDCFARLIQTAVQHEQHWPPQCCLTPIPLDLIRKNIPAGMRQSFSDRVDELSVPPSERVYCHDRSCGALIRPSQIDTKVRRGRCEQGHQTCTICYGPVHGDLDCPQDRALYLTEALASDCGWRRCANCRAMIEHREACQHITCRCGYQFCYVCGGRWRSCTCTMEQLQFFKAASVARQAERLAREARETAELDDALRQIEEFEREEKARKEERERKRVEDEMRQRKLDEWLRLEPVLQREVRMRFAELRDDLGNIHRSQQAKITRAAEDEAAELAAHVDRARRRLTERQAAEAEALVELAKDRLCDLDLFLAWEHAVRAEQEIRIEQEHEERLRSWWAGQKPSEACQPAPEGERQRRRQLDVDGRVKEDMAKLMQRMDQDHRIWKADRDGELAALQAMSDEEACRAAETRRDQLRRAEKEFASRKAVIRGRAAANATWFRVVRERREEMVAVMESEEMELLAEEKRLVERKRLLGGE